MIGRTRGRVFLSVLIGCFTLAGSAGGYAVGRVFPIRPGESADFSERGSAWRCTNVSRQYVQCQGGDAFPYVKLGGGTWPCGCVTVKVYTLRDPQGGHVIRTYESGYPVYIFRAL